MSPRFQGPQNLGYVRRAGTPRCVPRGAHTPVFLSSTIDIEPSGQSAMRNVAFKNPFQTAIEITEVRFQIVQSQVTLDPVGVNAAGGGVGAKISLGKFPMTDGLIPIWNLGRAVSLKNEIMSPIAYYTTCEYDWRLDDPFVLPPRIGPDITVSNFGKIQSALTVTVSLCGRKLDQNPEPGEKVRIPWVSSWQSEIFTSAASVLASTETDLSTPQGRGIRLNWLSQRALSVFPGSELNDSYAGNPGNSDAAWFKIIKMRIQDSRGYPIMKNLGNYASNIDPMTRVWDFGRGGIPLPADTYWLVIAENSGTSNGYTGQLQMALGGSYAVDYAEMIS